LNQSEREVVEEVFMYKEQRCAYERGVVEDLERKQLKRRYVQRQDRWVRREVVEEVFRDKRKGMYICTKM